MGLPHRYNSRELTTHLRQLAAMAHTTDDGGDPVTKGQVLAELVFKMALGYEEVDADNPQKKVFVRPSQWAIQLIYERLEGKTPTAIADEKTGIRVADRVSELGKSRINAISRAIVGITSGPPAYRKRES